MSKFASDDEIQLRIAANVLGVVVPLMLVVSVSTAGFILIFNQAQWTRAIPAGFVALTLGLVWWLSRSGRTLLATHVFIVCYAITIVMGMILNGGVKAPIWSSGALSLVAFIAWLYRRKVAISASVAIIVIGGLFVALEGGGLLPAELNAPHLTWWVITSAILVILLFAVVTPNRMLRLALAETQEALQREQTATGARKESDERFETLAANIPGVSYRCRHDPDWTMDYISDGVVPLTGYPASDFLQNSVRSFASIIHPEDSERVAEQVEVGVTKGHSFAIEYRLVRVDGGIRWVYERGQGILDEQDDVRFFDGVIVDITARKQAELELAKRNEQYRLLAENVHDVIWTAGTDLRMRYISPSVQKLRGYTPAEVSQQSLHEMLTVESVERAMTVFEKYYGEEQDSTAQSVNTITLELEHKTKDGGTVWCEVTMSLVRESVGQPAQIVGVSRDITQRRAAEAALLESERKHRTYVQSAPDGIFVMDNGGSFIDVNEAACELTGYSQEKLLGLSFAELAPKEGQPGVQRNIATVQDRGRLNTEVTLCRRGGMQMPVSLHAVRLSGDALMAFCSDLSETKRAKKERLNLATVVEQAEELIVITDMEGTIQYVNPSFERTTGYSQEDSIGRNARLLKSGKQDLAFYQHLWKTISNGRTWRGRMINRKKDGSFYKEESVISPIRDDDSGQIVNYAAVKRDITQEVALQEQLQQSQKMEAVGRLAGGVAHDFNNLLTGISGYAEMMSMSLGKDDPLLEDVEEIRKTAERASALTGQLLAFSRKQVISPRIIEIDDIIAEAKSMLERIISEDVELIYLPGEDVGQIKADPTQLDQILVNLLVNARDALPNGGKVTIETQHVHLVRERVTIGDEVREISGEYVMLAVSDNGVGMDSKTRSHIFEPFFSTKKKGTGLGLSTIYGIVAQNQGFITVYSEEGIGTTFKVYFPFVEERADRHTEQEQEQAPLPRGGETILLAEDEETVRLFAKKVLTRQGYRVLDAANGGEAYLRSLQFDDEIHLLITDVIMPQMNGRELHQELQKRRPGLLVLYMSGYTDTIIAHQGVLEDGAAFIQKPFRIKSLVSKVREVLDGGQS